MAKKHVKNDFLYDIDIFDRVDHKKLDKRKIKSKNDWEEFLAKFGIPWTEDDSKK